MHRIPFLVSVFVLALFTLTGAALLVDWWWCLPETTTAHYVGGASCRDCHQKEYELWQGSDHDRAMDLATEATVLGDFNNQEYTHFGVTSKFFRRDEDFFVTTDDRDGQMKTFRVKYVFGVRPLQQYLVEFPDGRVQCLPLAWDTEKKRWFHLYPDDPMPATDPLHWTGPLQNWNYMCAECHSTNLQKGYDLESNTYHTTFSEIDVNCETCHGPGSTHVDLAESWSPFWDRRHRYALPNLKNENSHVEIETCAPCHARRRIIHGGAKPGEPFLDYYLPEMLDSNLYYADGQILEEDYVYGSFIQSRMYHEAVRCTDCHDPHSVRVKFDDNRLCGQCHTPAQYDTPTHHHHPDASQPGTLCVECHMPETTYMVVDPRRDHSIRIPRPDLTVELGIPNACNGCHHDKAKGETPEWAEQTVQTWYGPRKGPPHFAHAIAAGREGKPEGESMLLALVRRKNLSAMVRASAILLLARYGSADAQAAATQALDDPEALVRTAAVRALQTAAPQELIRRVGPLLEDPLRSVRVEAARVLSVVPRSSLPDKYQKPFDSALAEYKKGQEATHDQAAAHLNLAVIHANQGDLNKAEHEYAIALKLDPGFVPARVNLAMLYYQQGKWAEAEAAYRKALEFAPEMGEIHYSLALLLAEQGERLDEVAALLAKAAELLPQNARVRYNRGLALMKLDRLDEAETSLKAAYELDPDTADYLVTLTKLYAQREAWPRALACAKELVRRYPHEPQMQALLKHIEHAAGQARPEGK